MAAEPLPIVFAPVAPDRWHGDVMQQPILALLMALTLPDIPITTPMAALAAMTQGCW